MIFKAAFLLSVFFIVRSADAADCGRARAGEVKAMYQIFRDKAESSGVLAAGFIRAAFHDCVTANPNDPDSGCNGSLKFEVTDINNLRLAPTMKEIESVQEGHPCISLADSILIAYSAASQKLRGGNVLKRLVDLRGEGRKDAAGPDFALGDDGAQLLNADGNPFITLPNPGDRSWANQLAFYENKLLTANDLVASLVVGHSVGGFQVPNGGPFLLFTETSPERVNGDYCGALLVRQERSLAGNLPRFNFLPSDLSLIDDAAGVNLLKELCSVDVPERENYSLKFGEQKDLMTERFLEFSIRMSQLTGAKLKAAGKPVLPSTV